MSKDVNQHSLHQVARFVTVGVIATGVHGVALYMLVENILLEPLVANSFAFLSAVVVSYVGHYRWTYNANSRHAHTFLKFFTLASMGFAMNALIMEVTVNTIGLHYLIGFLIIVLTIPAATYIVGRYWVFQ